MPVMAIQEPIRRIPLYWGIFNSMSKEIKEEKKVKERKQCKACGGVGFVAETERQCSKCNGSGRE